MRVFSRMLLLVFALITVISREVYCQTKSVVFSPKIEVVGGSSFDFGAIHRGEKVTHVFTIKNVGSDTLFIRNVTATCGCTAAVVSTSAVPAQGTADAELIALATAAKADFDGVATGALLSKTVDVDATITGSADSNGTANTPGNIGTALPARAIITAVEYKLTTPASGGSVATATLQVGYAGAQDALLLDLDLVAASAGSFDQNSGTSASSKTLPLQAGGKQLTYTVTPDVGHKLSALTALALTINVFYMVPA